MIKTQKTVTRLTHRCHCKTAFLGEHETHRQVGRVEGLDQTYEHSI